MAVKTIKPGIRVLLFLFLAAAFSCEEQGWFADCNDCSPEEPANEYLIIKITRSQAPVIIDIYEGEFEDRVLLESVNSASDTYRTSVRLNKKYTATATYDEAGRIYTAVDSAFPRTKFTETQCTDPCWYVYDNEIDLRLKYKAE